MSHEPFIVSRVARQLIIEYGECATSAASIFMEESLKAGHLDQVRNWEAVKDALLQMQPGTVTKIKTT